MRRILVVAAALVGLGIFQGPPVLAHNSLTQSSPQRGSMLTVAPSRVTLTFDLPCTGGQLANVVLVTNETGERVDNRDSQIASNVLSATLKPLSSGIYTVSFRVVSDDGHPVNGGFQFQLNLPEGSPTESATASPTTSAVSTSPTPRTTKQTHSPSVAPSITSPAPTPSTDNVTETPLQSDSASPVARPTVSDEAESMHSSNSALLTFRWSWLILGLALIGIVLAIGKVSSMRRSK